MEENQVSESKFVAAESVIERLKQSFLLYKNNFIGITLLILFYNMLAFVVSTGLWNQIVHYITKGQNTDLNIIELFMSHTSLLAIIVLIAII
jgi:hypothetical protein